MSLGTTIWLRWGSALVAQGAGDGVPAGVGTTQVESVWDFLVKGGPVIVPIAICSLVALTVVVERLVTLRRKRIIPPGFLAGLRAILKDGIYDRDEALDYCREDASPIAEIVTAGIKHLHAPIDRLEKQIEEAGRRVVLKLRRHLRALSVIAAICPLLGLLGTIFGMIDAFQTVAVSGEALGKTEMLAKGIYQAMITTAAGLSVAIPVIIAFHWIAAKIDGLVLEMDRLTVEFVEEFAGHGADTGSASLTVTDDDDDDGAEKAVAGGAAVA
ncbi:MAG: MotA/TolQ/ExbB proton channel family protein [Planctomycetota bacterium]|jgi:biopolymer transport protein ExbB